MSGSVNLDRGSCSGSWVAQKASAINESGEKLTDGTTETAGAWIRATVPGT
jgi:hypothetical protein